MFVAMALGLIGCDSPPSQLFFPQEHISATYNSDSDSIAWNGNVLEFVDSAGVYWRYERDGSDGNYTEFRIYKNGSHQVTMQPTFAGTSLDGNRLMTVDGMNSYEANLDGDLESATAGSGGGAPPIKQESVGGPSGSAECFGVGRSSGEVGTLHGHDKCANEYDAMQSAAWEAAWTGAVTSALFATPGAQVVGIAFAGVFADRSIRAAARLVEWGACKIYKE